VLFDGISSNVESITHGVPKGSILEPLLFTILINDLPSEIKYFNILLYADDTVIYYGDKSLANIKTCINADANRMKENCLILNLKKENTELIV